VTFELVDAGDEVKLVVTHEVLESFPDDIPEFTRENCQGGWEYFIHRSLQDFLKGSKE
jgi:hypothetical protein